MHSSYIFCYWIMSLETDHRNTEKKYIKKICNTRQSGTSLLVPQIPHTYKDLQGMGMDLQVDQHLGVSWEHSSLRSTDPWMFHFP